MVKLWLFGLYMLILKVFNNVNLVYFLYVKMDKISLFVLICLIVEVGDYYFEDYF